MSNSAEEQLDLPKGTFPFENCFNGYRRGASADLPGFGLSKPPAHYQFTPEEHTALAAEFLNRAD